MTDIGPLPPCPYGKKGRHDAFIVPSPDDEHGMWLTYVCGPCGAMRRVAPTGDILVPLDDLTSDDIYRAVRPSKGRTSL